MTRFDIALASGKSAEIAGAEAHLGFLGTSVVTSLLQAYLDNGAAEILFIGATVQYKNATISCMGTGAVTEAAPVDGWRVALSEIAQDCIDRLDGENGAKRKRDAEKVGKERAVGIRRVDAAGCTNVDSPASPEHYFDVGQSLWKTGQYEPAMICYIKTQAMARQGPTYREACFQIGVMYELGQGVKRDKDAAKLWYGRAGLQF